MIGNFYNFDRYNFVRYFEQTQNYVRKNFQDNGMGMPLLVRYPRPSYVCSNPSQTPEKLKNLKVI